MRITDTRITVVGAPWRELVFLELQTDEGLIGVSDVRMVNYRMLAAAAVVSAILVFTSQSAQVPLALKVERT
ncbi:MAG: hypothetical protein ACRD2N_00415 [Vicinamibacterales bacterium]